MTTPAQQDEYVMLRDKQNTVKCHHRNITRLHSEQLLTAAKEDGSFLIRDSETIQGAYTLCLLHQGRVHQYRVIPDNTGKIYVQAEKGVQERKFSDLGQLVQDYLKRGSRNGLVCALKHPVEVLDESLYEFAESDDDDDDDEGSSNRRSLHSHPPSSGRCQPHSPPSANSSGSSVGSNTSLDKPARVGSRTVTTLDHRGGSPQSSSGSTTPASSHSGDLASSGSPATTTGKTKGASPGPAGGRPEGSRVTSGWLDRDNDYVEDFTLENNPVRRYIMSRFSQLDLSTTANSFPTALKDYIENGVFKDSTAVNSGEDTLPHLRRLLAVECRELDMHLESFLEKIDICRQLFGPITTTALAGNRPVNNDVPDLDSVLNRLFLCKSAILKLEKKATHRLHDLAAEESSASVTEVSHPPALPDRGPKEPPVIPSSSFEAKMTKSGMKLSTPHKVTLKVDIHQGKLFMVRPSKDVLDSSNVFPHDKVLQLIKSTTNASRLDIRLEGRKGKDAIFFEDLRQRESFCQLMQQMKFFHSSHQEVDRLSIFIGTWNMGDEPAPVDIHDWLRCQGQGKSRDSSLAVLAHDIYVIGTQESGSTEKEFVQRIQRALTDCCQTELQLLNSSTLWGIRLVILVKPAYKNKITHIQQSTVKTGIANALGNKGAAAISFSFNGTSFCFINCHLTSGFEKNQRRNQNVRNIIKNLNLGNKSLGLFDVTNQFHHVFFLGDLNYRLHGMESSEIIKKIYNEEFQDLEPLDQLKGSQNKGECFVTFTEEEITFPPTYRIAKGSLDKYEWQKVKSTGIRINAPSWCDRVLWKSYPDTYIINTSYGSVNSIKTSDHKPVFSSFDIGIVNQFAGSNTVQARGTTGDMSVIFENVHAEVKTSTKDQFKLEFYSTCLEAPVSSNHSWQYDNPKGGCVCPQWKDSQIPHLYPIVDDRDYLEDQHILIAVKSADSMESYGECVVALKSMFAIRSQPFATQLTHMGEETGHLKGRMYVKCKEDKASSRGRRSYELIYMDTSRLVQERETLSRNTPDFSAYAIAEERGPMFSVPGMTKTPVSQTTSLNAGTQPPRSWDNSRANSSQLDGGKTLGAASSDRGKADQPGGLSYESIWLRNSGASAILPNPGEEQLGERHNSDPPPKPNFRDTSPPKPRKPRLGQSSLAPSTVLPVTTSTEKSLSPGAVPAVTSIGSMEYDCVSFPGGAVPDRKRQEGGAVRRPTRDTPSPSSPRHPLVSQQKSLPTNGIRSPSPTKTNRNSDSSDNQEPASDYDILRPPATVDEWLTDLGLPQYVAAFQAQGWDQLDFISDISEDDLRHMDVKNKEHRAKIMESICSLEKVAGSWNSIV